MRHFTILLICFFLITNLFSQSKTEELNELLQTYNMLNTFNGSAMVIYKGEVLLNTGYGIKNVQDKSKAYSTTIYQLGSVTKQFTATVILKLEKQKKLNINDPISKYIPEILDSNKISIYHLLTHTSGIYNYTDDGDFMQNKLEKPISKAEIIKIINSHPVEFKAGTKMKYSNSGYMLLGYIIEAVTGKKYEDVVREMIFTPLKMQNSGFDFAHLVNNQKATGYDYIRDGIGKKTVMVDSTVSFAGGAIYSNTEDLLKWHSALLNKNFISESIKEKLFTPYLNDFGMGWVIDKFFEKKGVFHNGSIPGFTSNIYRIVDDNTCIILLNNIANRNIDTITKNLLCVLYDKPYHKPQVKTEIAFTDKDVQKYVGEYQFEGNFRMKISSQNNRLFAQRIGEDEPFEMFLYKKDSFFLKAFEADLLFTVNDKDKIEKLCLIQSKRTMCANKAD
ncbi:MAG TPA: hypothetical protein DHV26_06815 [Cytophagales bacterium]|nr:hypothetical protein [Cytophagales bacterium]